MLEKYVSLDKTPIISNIEKKIQINECDMNRFLSQSI